MSESPRFCSWAPDRLLRDPVVRRMNAEAFGGYCSLLVEAWLEPSGSLPDDDEELALLSRLGKNFPRYSKVIRRLFFVDEEGRLRSAIVEEPRERIRQRSLIGQEAVKVREERKMQKLLQLEPKNGSNDHRPIIDRLSKEKEKEKEKENTPSSPSGTSGRSGRRSATDKGNPANEETWKRFDEVYPRPGNGRKLERALARKTWDILAGEEEDLEAIIAGAKAYGDWIRALKKIDFVAMMTTFLNQRRWEESYEIDPSSEDGKRIKQEQEAELRERRSEILAELGPEYEACIEKTILDRISDPTFFAEWKQEAEANLAKYEKLGLSGAITIARRILEDPSEGVSDRIRLFRERYTLPTFEEWESGREGAKTA